MQVSILGCGWLGLPLAKAMIAKGFTVKGSTTTPDKTEVLSKAGIHPFLIDLDDELPALATSDFLCGSEILIINIPPKVKANSAENYAGKLQKLLPFIKEAAIQKVLFVSSTSVYADNNSFVTEDSLANPDTESGRQVLQAEQLLQGMPYFKTTILRFAGLIGEGRNPVKYLAGRENIPNPDAPVNLIHQTDCIGIIMTIIEKNIWGEVFNAASPQHPSREVYYTNKAAESGLPQPKFDHTKPCIGKTIAVDKVEQGLGYTFKQGL